jgi:predicted PurR-regulated permease PerM
MVLDRRRLLGVLLVAMVALAATILASVLRTVVFAITVAYVLYPLRQVLVRRGASDRVAGAASTAVAFLVAVGLVAPVLYVLYRQRTQLIEALGRIPETIPLSAGEFDVVIEIEPLVVSAQALVRQVAIDVTAAAPRLVLELAVFTFLVYGLLRRPSAVGTAVFKVIPPEYHDIPTRLHVRTRMTLYSIYVLQAATAAATFALALALFSLLGYGSPILLAVIAGVLQFVPIVGPSVLVVALAAGDLLIGETTRAITVLALGLIVVSFIPDAVIRTQLADRTGKISSGLYFVGFVGGILTVGAIGLIVGPLVVSLLIEVIEMIAEGNGSAVSADAAVDTATDATDATDATGSPDSTDSTDAVN